MFLQGLLVNDALLCLLMVRQLVDYGTVLSCIVSLLPFLVDHGQEILDHLSHIQY